MQWDTLSCDHPYILQYLAYICVLDSGKKNCSGIKSCFISTSILNSLCNSLSVKIGHLIQTVKNKILVDFLYLGS